MAHYYEKLDEKMDLIRCPQDDKDGSIVQKMVNGVPLVVLNVPIYFDEHPEERKRLGWVKHITHDPETEVEYNKQTQFLVKSTVPVDEYTVEDTYHVLDKSEEQLAFEDMLSVATGEGSIMWL